MAFTYTSHKGIINYEKNSTKVPQINRKNPMLLQTSQKNCSKNRIFKNILIQTKNYKL